MKSCCRGDKKEIPGSWRARLSLLLLISTRKRERSEGGGVRAAAAPVSLFHRCSQAPVCAVCDFLYYKNIHKPASCSLYSSHSLYISLRLSYARFTRQMSCWCFERAPTHRDDNIHQWKWLVFSAVTSSNVPVCEKDDAEFTLGDAYHRLWAFFK